MGIAHINAGSGCIVEDPILVSDRRAPDRLLEVLKQLYPHCI
jgi:hypothetical protein